MAAHLSSKTQVRSGGGGGGGGGGCWEIHTAILFAEFFAPGKRNLKSPPTIIAANNRRKRLKGGVFSVFRGKTAAAVDSKGETRQRFFCCGEVHEGGQRGVLCALCNNLHSLGDHLTSHRTFGTLSIVFVQPLLPVLNIFSFLFKRKDQFIWFMYLYHIIYIYIYDIYLKTLFLN